MCREVSSFVFVDPKCSQWLHGACLRFAFVQWVIHTLSKVVDVTTSAVLAAVKCARMFAC